MNANSVYRVLVAGAICSGIIVLSALVFAGALFAPSPAGAGPATGYARSAGPADVTSVVVTATSTCQPNVPCQFGTPSPTATHCTNINCATPTPPCAPVPCFLTHTPTATATQCTNSLCATQTPEPTRTPCGPVPCQLTPTPTATRYVNAVCGTPPPTKTGTPCPNIGCMTPRPTPTCGPFGLPCFATRTPGPCVNAVCTPTPTPQEK